MRKYNHQLDSEAIKLELEKYKLWLSFVSNIYKGFISILFPALILIIVFYLNKFQNFDWSSTLNTLIVLFFFISAIYYAVYSAIMRFVNALISDAKRNKK